MLLQWALSHHIYACEEDPAAEEEHPGIQADPMDVVGFGSFDGLGVREGSHSFQES